MEKTMLRDAYACLCTLKHAYVHISMLIHAYACLCMPKHVWACVLFLIKNIFELRFFFLILCLIVGEACLGLSLIVIGSRFQKKELLSLSLI